MRLDLWTLALGVYTRLINAEERLILSSFATGWNYFAKYLILLPTNLTASGLIIQYWRPDLNVAIWVTVFGLSLVFLNVWPLSSKHFHLTNLFD